MQALQHPPDTLLRLQNRPLAPHPRLHPPGIHTDNPDASLPFALDAQVKRLMHRQHIQRGLADRISGALGRLHALGALARPEPRRHIHHDASLAQMRQESLDRLRRPDDIDADFSHQVLGPDVQACLF